MDHTKHKIQNEYKTKRGGVCPYYECSLPLKVVEVSYLQKCINKFVCLYRSPSQTKDEFENSIKNLELNLEHIAGKSSFL